jgi:two-component system chemotaxis response regulator CheB
LSVVLPHLAADFSLPIMIVVHQPPDRRGSIAELFQTKCQVRVKEAEDKEPILPGTVYFAPPNYHLLVEQGKVLSLSTEEEINFSRPSIDALFETAADAYGAGLLGIILTGANFDGARGLQAVCANGGAGVVQSPETAEATLMPKAALAGCGRANVMELNSIAALLQRLGGNRAYGHRSN